MLDDGLEGRCVALVESHAGLRRELAAALERSGYRVAAFATVPPGLESSRYRVRVLDLAAPGVDRWLAEWHASGGIDGGVIGLSGHADVADAGRPTPPGLPMLAKPFALEALEAQLRAALAQVDACGHLPADPLLESRQPEMHRLLARARALARRSVPICLEGELGTGRRALAQAIHDWSPRAGGAFGRLEATRLASEAGGAAAEVVRAVARSAGGTLVLVEPEEWPASAIAALVDTLRALPEREAPRWITLSRRPLEDAVRSGALPVELEYRLDAVRLVLPSLGERPLDHTDLCRGLARRVARSLGRPTPEIDDAFVAALARDGFPGNRLGLESRLRAALIAAEADADPTRGARLVAPVAVPPRASDGIGSLDLATLERDAIVRALAHHRGNRTHASASLGISVRTLRNKIRAYGLR